MVVRSRSLRSPKAESGSPEEGHFSGCTSFGADPQVPTKCEVMGSDMSSDERSTFRGSSSILIAGGVAKGLSTVVHEERLRMQNTARRPAPEIGGGPAMGVLRVNVLGPPEVFHDESRLSFALRKAQALLLYLAVEGGLQPRSKLATLLWPDSEPSVARLALRNALSLLRSPSAQ